MKIYVVTKGRYDSYEMCKAFKKQSVAEQYAAAQNEAYDNSQYWDIPDWKKRGYASYSEYSLEALDLE